MKQFKPSTELNLVGEIIVGYKTKDKVKVSEQPKIITSLDSQRYLRQIYTPDTMEHVESAYLIVLNNANRVLGWAKISSGGLTGTVMDIKVILQICLQSNAKGFIICHNHPSGNDKPSTADIEISRKIKAGANLLDINMFDSCIITEDSFYSLEEEGLL